ncbi:MAG: hypothetical protein IPI90_15700 [Saprospiraceae bacterium]|nr:hypothetical protein [Candidatus Vicinibacter affinis]
MWRPVFEERQTAKVPEERERDCEGWYCWMLVGNRRYPSIAVDGANFESGYETGEMDCMHAIFCR